MVPDIDPRHRVFRALVANSPGLGSADAGYHWSRLADVVTYRDPLQPESRTGAERASVLPLLTAMPASLGSFRLCGVPGS